MPTREVPLAEAATLLGLTPEAVRQRLKRGKTLRGTRRADGWYVAVPSAEVATDRDRPATTNGDHTPPDAPAGAWSRPNAATDCDHSRLAAQDAELAFLRAEVERLHERLAAEQERLREAHVLLVQRPALPAPLGAPTDPSGGLLRRVVGLGGSAGRGGGVIIIARSGYERRS